MNKDKTDLAFKTGLEFVNLFNITDKQKDDLIDKMGEVYRWGIKYESEKADS